MIDPRYTQQLYDALNQLLEATCYIDVQEVGGQPLQDAWNEADKLQQEIDDCAPVASKESAELFQILTDPAHLDKVGSPKDMRR